MGRALRFILLGLCITALLPSHASAAVAWGPQRTLADWAWSTGSSLAATGSGSDWWFINS